MWLSAFFLIALVGCEKFDEKNVGGTLLPEGDKAGIFRVDTFSLKTSVFTPDSIATDELSLLCLGEVNDPVYGNQKAGIFSQFLLSQNNISFGDNPVLDSVVFSMRISSIYGDSATSFTFNIQEATEDYALDSNHYSNTTVVTTGENLIFPGQETNVFSVTDSISLETGKVAPQIRMRLKDEFGQKILNATSTDLTNNENFLQFLKGIYTTATIASGTKGAVYYLAPTALESRISIYYTSDSDTSTTQQEFRIGVNAVAERFTTFTNDYTGTPVEQALNGNDDGSNVYIQSGAGVASLIEIPYLKSILDSGLIAINKAELHMYYDYSDPDFAVHKDVFVARVDDDGKNQIIADQFEGSAHFGGVLVDSIGNQMVINITRHLQQVLNGQVPQNGLQLLPIAAGVSVNRTVFGGQNSVNKKPQLIIYYTKP